VESTVWIPLAFTSVGIVLATRPARGAWVLRAVLFVTLALGGLTRATTLYQQVRDFDRGILTPAEWLGANLRPSERVAILHVSQVLWVTDLREDQVIAYGTFAAGDLETLRREMQAREITHAAWTYRRPADNPSQRFYDDRKNVSLAEPFRAGDPVAGFELVATLPAPDRLEQPPARIYRLLPSGATPPLPAASGAPSSPARPSRASPRLRSMP
jgi:hypothetical protein